MIRFQCYNCGQIFRARDDSAGKTGKCKRCGVPLQIPVFVQGGGPPPGPPPGPTPSPVNPLGFLNNPPAASPNLRGGSSRPRPGTGLGIPVASGLVVGLVVIGLMFAFAEPLQAVAPGIAPKNPFRAPAVQINPPVAVAVAGPNAPNGGPSFEPPAWLGALLHLGVSLLVISTPITVPVALSRAGCLSIGRWLCLGGFCGLACFGCVYAADAIASVQPYGLDLAPREIRTAMSILAFGAILTFVCIMGCVLAAALYPKPKTA